MRLRTAFLMFFFAVSVTHANDISLVETSPLHLNWLDTQVLPTENFYGYANGTWQKNNPIPAAYSSWNNFRVLEKATQLKLRQMLTALINNPRAPEGSIEQKIGDFYYSGMDEVAINQAGTKPLKAIFSRIDAIQTTTDLQKIIPFLHKIGVDAVFGFSSMQDFKNSEEMIGAAFQGGLGLPNRDYYFNKGKKFAVIRAAYVQHIAKIAELLGDTPAQAKLKATTVMAIETKLAKASLTSIQQRDPYAIYHMMDRAALEKMTPNFSWPDYFTALGVPSIEHINVAMPEFFKAMNTMLNTISLEDWKIYLRWHVMEAFAGALSQPFVDESFHMSSVLTGAKTLLPRWQRVINTENQALDFAIGKYYVEHYFSEADKALVVEIMHNIRAVFRQTLQTVNWMTPATRQAALKKLDLMEERIGYPKTWRDYSTLTLNRGPYVLNIIRANQFAVQRDLKKIGKPVDREEWSMAPQTVNAYYDPSLNTIAILAGILQPPIFDPKAPAAVNYGAIGSVIGHEMTHGFDDQGALFDAKGNLKNWWTPSDFKQFNAATDCIAQQFSQYKVDDTIPVQGKLVVGEATADLGGMILAYQAFHAAKVYESAKTIDGFTPDQQFFLGAAHAWAGNIRPELARHYATVDPHPPMMFRINGTLANMPQFQAAFNVPEMSPMVNRNRCAIW